METFEKSK